MSPAHLWEISDFAAESLIGAAFYWHFLAAFADDFAIFQTPAQLQAANSGTAPEEAAVLILLGKVTDKKEKFEYDGAGRRLSSVFSTLFFSVLMPSQLLA